MELPEDDEDELVLAEPDAPAWAQAFGVTAENTGSNQGGGFWTFLRFPDAFGKPDI